MIAPHEQGGIEGRVAFEGRRFGTSSARMLRLGDLECLKDKSSAKTEVPGVALVDGSGTKPKNAFVLKLRDGCSRGFTEEGRRATEWVSKETETMVEDEKRGSKGEGRRELPKLHSLLPFSDRLQLLAY